MTELGCGNVRYSEAVRQLEGLLELERETLSVKRKVSGFTVDYDDDLVINVEYCCLAQKNPGLNQPRLGEHSGEHGPLQDRSKHIAGTDEGNPGKEASSFLFVAQKNLSSLTL